MMPDLRMRTCIALPSSDATLSFEAMVKIITDCMYWTLQVDSAQVKLAKAHVHHAAALQAAKQQAQADKARQKRLKTLQKQQVKAR